MNTKAKFVVTALAAIMTGALAAGCSQSPTTTPTTASGTASSPALTQASATGSQAFNPTVAPPAGTPCYSFQQTPAPTPAQTTAVTHQVHRYLHVVYKSNHCYLADNYGNYYNTGRTSSGNLYPVYQDSVTDAVYPLYYDEQRDSYYRCVDNAPDQDANGDAPAGYYRNYVGDPDDEFYEGDPDQQEECQSDDSQPFIVNYYSDDSGDSYYRHHHWHGYNPSFAIYSGPNYHQNDFTAVVPLIVAAYILFEPQQGGYGQHGGGRYGGGGGYYNNQNTVIVNNHYYYQRTVDVNKFNNHPTNVPFAAMPGPPLGHFAGYKPAGGSYRQNNGNHGGNMLAYGNHRRALPPVMLPGQRVIQPHIPVAARLGNTGERQTTRYASNAESARRPMFPGEANGNPRASMRTASNPTMRIHSESGTQHSKGTGYMVSAVGAAVVYHAAKTHNRTAANRTAMNSNGKPRANYAGRPAAGAAYRTASAGATQKHRTSEASRTRTSVASRGISTQPARMIDRSTPGGRTAYAMRPRTTDHSELQSHHLRTATQQPPHEYIAPRSTYQAPRVAYTAPRPVYHAPRPEYQAARTTYQAPRAAYSAPRPVYQAPRATYQAPRVAYSAPRPTYRAPQTEYQAPRETYQAPRQQFQAQAPPRASFSGGGGGGRPSGGGGHSSGRVSTRQGDSRKH